MSVNDPISDMLIRIRNAANAKHPDVMVPHSRIKEGLAKIMRSEGFVGRVEVAGEGTRKRIVIGIKYRANGKPVFNELKRESRLGRRHYIRAGAIKPNRQGMGVAVLSTSKGLMKDTDAKRQGVGGEILCTMW